MEFVVVAKLGGSFVFLGIRYTGSQELQDCNTQFPSLLHFTGHDSAQQIGMVLCYPQNQLLNHHPSQKQPHNTMKMPLANAVCTTPSKAMILNPYSNGKGTILKRGASIDIFCRLVALRRTIASKWVIKVLTHVHGQWICCHCLLEETVEELRGGHSHTMLLVISLVALTVTSMF